MVKAELMQEKRTTRSIIDVLKKENEELKRQKAKMKEEWAEIYSTLKADIESYKGDIQVLNNENDKLLKLTDKSASQSRKSEMETMKKLSKRELECSALWDTIRDLYKGYAVPTEKESMEKLFSVRALEIKAKRKVFK
jgi:hypothetical protein